jgi:dihydrodipicolinate reductase
VIGTTGFDVEALDEAARAAGVPCLFAPNFAIGSRVRRRP